ncbi:endonuclease/exonuclease/phosphatase family protein [Phycicoccus ginsengisoli]
MSGVRCVRWTGLVASTLLAALAAGVSGAPAAGAAAPPPTAAPPVVARFATYNIHAGAGSDNVYDLDRTAAAIQALDADVVGLEEADVHWGERSRFEDTVAELGRRLGMRTGFAPIYSLDPLHDGDPRREYGVAVLSRYPVVALENHEITRLSTQDPDPVPAPAPGFLEATIQVRGARTHVYVTHLDYRGDPSVRTAQVADTRRIMAQDPPGANQVLLGDFNADASAPELAPLWEELDDAWRVAGSRVGEPGLTYPASRPVKRIDFVTVRKGTPVTVAEVPSDPGLLAASDHRPVVATVQLPVP